MKMKMTPRESWERHVASVRSGRDITRRRKSKIIVVVVVVVDIKVRLTPNVVCYSSGIIMFKKTTKLRTCCM